MKSIKAGFYYKEQITKQMEIDDLLKVENCTHISISPSTSVWMGSERIFRNILKQNFYSLLVKQTPFTGKILQ